MFSDKHKNSQNTAKNNNSEFGKEGERAACEYLRKNGYSILSTNVWEKFGEVDVIARHPQGALVFVEVKSVNSNKSGFSAEDQMTQAKIKKLKRTCEFIANKYPELINKHGWQIDSLCLTKIDNYYDIKYYENIV
jgi:Holliday junction resolvase-like predicted endonuclease